MPRDPFAAAREVIAGGIDAASFPAAVIDVGSAAGSEWREAFGRLTYDIAAPIATPGTVFDLASLTKVIATASIAMRLVEAGRLSLEDPVARYLPEFHAADRASITIRQLLDHSSGLPAHARLYEQGAGRAFYESALSALPLDRPPGSSSVYSDAGFMLLGFILEDVGGAPLDAQFAPIAEASGEDLRFIPPATWSDRIAPTELDPWRGRVLRGEVHDENAAALGGVAAHAGLFGTAGAVAAFARLVLTTFARPTLLATPATMRLFATRTAVPDSTRALAWDTMKPTSSSGTKMSPTAIGHTGFTGTSLWIDWERDRYVVFLTNRVHPTRANDALVKLGRDCTTRFFES